VQEGQQGDVEMRNGEGDEVRVRSLSVRAGSRRPPVLTCTFRNARRTLPALSAKPNAKPPRRPPKLSPRLASLLKPVLLPLRPRKPSKKTTSVRGRRRGRKRRRRRRRRRERRRFRCIFSSFFISRPSTVLSFTCTQQTTPAASTAPTTSTVPSALSAFDAFLAKKKNKDKQRKKEQRVHVDAPVESHPYSGPTDPALAGLLNEIAMNGEISSSMGDISVLQVRPAPPFLDTSA
jgi:hypothetical protein